MLKKISLDKIIPNPDQPRKVFDPRALEDLASSIEAHGLMQPITVRPIGKDSYMIVAGERRWRAHCLLRDTGRLPGGQVLARVNRMDDRTMALQAIVENMQRVDISPLEEAEALQAVVDTGMSVEDLAKKLGRHPRRIQDRLSLLKLAPEIRSLLRSGNLSQQYTWHLTELDEHRDQMKIVRMVMNGTLRSPTEAAAAVRRLLDAKSQPTMWGDDADAETRAERAATVNRMEKKISAVKDMVASGWKDGECIVAAKVNPGQTTKMADELALIRKHLLTMERQLREASGAELAIAS